MQTLVLRNSADDFVALIEEELESRRARNRGHAIMLARKRNGKAYNAWMGRRQSGIDDEKRRGSGLTHFKFRVIGG
jgi:hypothetical protein